MTTPDPREPLGDDSPTSPVDLPPLPPAQPMTDAVPPVGTAPWDTPGPVPPSGAWGGNAGPWYAPQPGPGRGPDPGYAASPSWTANARPAAQAQTPSGLVTGIVLVVIGVVFLLIRVVDVTIGSGSWPLWIIVPGLAMVAGSLAIPPRGGLGLAVPGTIIAIVGGILWVQDAYGLYATWAYAWALVAPTGPGFAMLVYGLVRGDTELAGDGFRTLLVGVGLFLGFGFFFEGVIGLSGHRIANLDEVLPYVAIGFGVLLVVSSLFGGGSRDRRHRRDQRA